MIYTHVEQAVRRTVSPLDRLNKAEATGAGIPRCPLRVGSGHQHGTGF